MASAISPTLRNVESADDSARATALDLLSFFDVQELEELVRWDQ